MLFFQETQKKLFPWPMEKSFFTGWRHNFLTLQKCDYFGMCEEQKRKKLNMALLSRWDQWKMRNFPVKKI